MPEDLYIGPLIERDGKYGYDAFSVVEGLKSSFSYGCVAQARYDQRALAAQAERDPRCNARLCETLNEFEEAVERARGRRATSNTTQH